MVCSLHRLLSELFLCYLGGMEHYNLFSDRSEVGGVRFSANTLPPESPVMEAWEYGMIAYFLEIPHPEKPFSKV